MRFIAFEKGGRDGLAVVHLDGHYRGKLDSGSKRLLHTALSDGEQGLRSLADSLLDGEMVDVEDKSVRVQPPIALPGKILCIGLNYADHTAEAGLPQPSVPTVFARFASNFVGHNAPMVRPFVSDQLDFEGELAAIIGRRGRHIAKESALEHIAGYSIFNDGSIRDFQTRTSQWTLGKNFDHTGAFGPCFVSADALPPGARGLKIETRLNGAVMQSASTSDLIFDVATLVYHLSQAMTLQPGDMIVTGTPSGVGAVRKPPIWMKPGDVCEVEIEGLGILRNPIMEEIPVRRTA